MKDEIVKGFQHASPLAQGDHARLLSEDFPIRSRDDEI
jgi:hypothetical protein